MHHILPEHTHYMQYTVGTSAPFTVRRSVNADTPTAAPHRLPQPASPSAKKGHHNHTPCNLTTGVLSHAGIMSRGEPNWGSPFGRWGPSQGLLSALLTPAAMHVCVRVLGKPANCARQPHAMDSPRQLTTSPRPGTPSGPFRLRPTQKHPRMLITPPLPQPSKIKKRDP